MQLIRDLFARLKTTSEHKQAKDDGKKSSIEPLSSEQLQRIGAMMADFIGQNGEAELERANLQRKGDRVALEAS